MMLCVINSHDEHDLSDLFQDVTSYAAGVFIQYSSICELFTTGML